MKRLWFVSFGPAAQLPWWMRLFTSEHVMCFGQADEHVVLVEPVHTHVEVSVAKNVSAIDIADAHVFAGREVWFLSMEPKTSRAASNVVPSCVSVVKSVLGLDSFCVTPKGLKKSLEKAGGKLYGKRIVEVEASGYIGAGIGPA